MVRKPAWCLHKYKHIGQWKRTEEPDVSSDTYDFLIFDIESRHIH